MEFILNVTVQAIKQVWLSWQHNWPYLILSIVIATLLRLYVKADRVSAFLQRHRGAGVVAATTAAVATPLCSCGTTAVVLGLVAGQAAWAPIVAFMVSSPLTSPQELVYSAGLFGWPFAIAFFLSSIVLGLAGGWIAGVLERRGWLKDQARFAGAAAGARPAQKRSGMLPLRALQPSPAYAGVPAQVTANCGCASLPAAPTTSCGCSAPMPALTSGCSCSEPMPAAPTTSCGCSAPMPATPTTGCSCGPADAAPAHEPPAKKITVKSFGQELYRNARYLLLMFTAFAFVGYFLNGLIPAGWVASIFGGGNIYNVPLAATLGLPLYINSEASLPLVRTLLNAGMSQGAALAFMIAGAGTSIGAVAGALTIARWRVVALVVGVLWIGAILCGLAYNLVLTI